ncbi:MAG: alcohol dehydrogenase catalytic domain-containing protein [Spirochaetes bacterium]|nr:alcohol dehydrogenase catalytic domain-containing protein [Spirochaetota bacterium]
MKAVVYEGVAKVAIREAAKPQVKDGSVVIRVHSCAICGTDVKAYTIGIASIKPPVTLGHEFTGSVHEAGKNVKGFSLGDRVTLATTLPCGNCRMCEKGLFNLCTDKLPVGTFIDGAFAEYVEVPERGIVHGNLIKVPEMLSDDEGALSEPLGCVINSQNIVQVGFPDTVAVIGAGPLGLLQAETAKARGALKTVLVQRSKRRFETARGFKIDHVVCSEETDPYEAVMELTGGNGADVVINAAPSLEAAALAFRIVAKSGRVSLFASMPKDDPSLSVDLNRIHYNQVAVYGASDSTARNHRDAVRLLSSGAISTGRLITHTLPLDDFFRGIDLIKKREALKVVIRP